MNYWSKVEWRFPKSNVVKLHYMNFIGPKIPGLLSRAISNHERIIMAGAQYLESQIVHFNLNSES